MVKVCFKKYILDCTKAPNRPFLPQVTDSLLLVEYPPTQHAHGLLSTALGLRVPVGRTMQVRCTARVAPAWREGSEAVVGNSQLADSKEAMLLGNLFYLRNLILLALYVEHCWVRNSTFFPIPVYPEGCLVKCDLQTLSRQSAILISLVTD